jgi:hypothetical protein
MRLQRALHALVNKGKRKCMRVLMRSFAPAAAAAVWVLLHRSFTAGSLPRSLSQRGPALYQGHSSRQSTQDEHQDD